MRWVMSIVAASLFAACGHNDVGENYGDILHDSPSGLLLTEQEHLPGWGRSDCFSCHLPKNIHLVDRTGGGLDLAAIQELVDSQGEASCASCH